VEWAAECLFSAFLFVFLRVVVTTAALTLVFGGLVVIQLAARMFATPVLLRSIFSAEYYLERLT